MQSLCGDQNDLEPSILFYVSNLKWHAWEKEKGLDRGAAKEMFIEICERILDKLEIAHPIEPAENYYKDCKGIFDKDELPEDLKLKIE